MLVLLVEDDLVVARGVALMLRGSGAVVDQADTGEEALELARHYDYDIVVLDLMLPDIEGFEGGAADARVARGDAGADPFRPQPAIGEGEGARRRGRRLYHQAVRPG